jgi:hypothetical protein
MCEGSWFDQRVEILYHVKVAAVKAAINGLLLNLQVSGLRCESSSRGTVRALHHVHYYYGLVLVATGPVKEMFCGGTLLAIAA